MKTTTDQGTKTHRAHATGLTVAIGLVIVLGPAMGPVPGNSTSRATPPDRNDEAPREAPPLVGHESPPTTPYLPPQPSAAPDWPVGVWQPVDGMDNARILRTAAAPARAGRAARGEGDDTIYLNESCCTLFAPGAGISIADDILPAAIEPCGITAYELTVSGGGDGTGPGFEVDTQLFVGCPDADGTPVAESAAHFVVPHDGDTTLHVDLPAGSLSTGQTLWLQVTFSEDHGGWYFGSPAVIGYTSPRFSYPTIPCTSQLGIHAGFAARLVGENACTLFEPTQVNVDANGLNIPNDAGNEPSIAVDPTNPQRMAIGWRQFDNIGSDFRQAGWAYTTDGGATWTFPGVLQENFFRSDPVLDVDADGTFYYSSLRGNFLCDLYRSNDGGVTWSEPTFAFGGDKQWITIDRTEGIGRGHIYQNWSIGVGCCGSATFNRSTDGGLTFSTPIPILNSPRWGTLTVDRDGRLYIGGIGTNGQLVVTRSSNAQDPDAVVNFEMSANVDLGGFPAFSVGPNPAGLLGQINVASDHSDGPTGGNVYMLGSVQANPGDPLDVMFSRSTDHGVTWSAPVRVNDDTAHPDAWQWFGTMSVAPNGRIDVVWNDTRNTLQDNLSELYYASSTDGGVTWSPNRRLTYVYDSHVGFPVQQKMGDYYDMVSLNEAALLAYAATFNGEQDVYFMRIDVDCNGNGVTDTTDVANGTSEDCNGNLVPDECERNEDCNENKVQDICDIAGGTSNDCNNNNTPDECEPDTDCDDNGMADFCDIANGTAQDCNGNAIPDTCDIAQGSSTDCNGNTVPDECDIASGADTDCNLNALPDDCDIARCDGDPACADCNANGKPDACDLTFDCGPPALTCTPDAGDCCNLDGNGTPGCNCASCCESICSLDPFCCQFEWDGACASNAIDNPACTCGKVISVDCNANGVPDECEPDDDCNANGTADICDLATGVSTDCNANNRPDECDLADGIDSDCAWGPGICCDARPEPGCLNEAVEACVCALDPTCCSSAWTDSCVLTLEFFGCGTCPGIPGPNGIPDSCDIANGDTPDCNNSLVPDACEPPGDFDADGLVDLADYATLPACLTGVTPGELPPGCCFFDVDADRDVDLADVTAFINALDP